MKLPIFSVVIPVYNVESYLSDCLESVINQSFTNFEIICVNDGSTDASLTILESFTDARIRIVTQTNRGLAAARNTGINAARGLFVALLDSDDAWAPTKLMQHFKHFQSNPNVDISFSASLFIDEEGELMGLGQFPRLYGIDAGHVYCRNPVGNGSAAVIRRSLLTRMGDLSFNHGERHYQYFDESMRQSEDIEFWLRCALKGNAVFEGVPDALTYYRVNKEGLSANVEKQMASWRYIYQKNRHAFPSFFEQYQHRAEAYQNRYLARRAIHSGNGVKAIKLMNRALLKCPDIFVKDPIRSWGSYACALLALLPSGLYSPLERLGMWVVSSGKERTLTTFQTLSVQKEA